MFSNVLYCSDVENMAGIQKAKHNINPCHIEI